MRVKTEGQITTDIDCHIDADELAALALRGVIAKLRAEGIYVPDDATAGWYFTGSDPDGMKITVTLVGTKLPNGIEDYGLGEA